MGRPRIKNHNLPPRMAMKNGVYYHVSNGSPRKWTKLGSNLPDARLEWAHIENLDVAIEDCTFVIVAAKYEREIVPEKALKTQKEYRRQIRVLNSVFGAMPLDSIKPLHIKQYINTRSAKASHNQKISQKKPAKVAANREKSLFSTIFNHAREWGYTDAPNPCAGIKGHSEAGRDRYVDDTEYLAVYEHADELLKDAMDLAYYTGQRVADVLKMKRTDIKEGAIWVQQNKTDAKIRIMLEGELAAVIERIIKRPRKITTMQLLQTETESLSYASLHHRFVVAREKAGVDFQFRDLRAKAATDLENLELAQKLLAHSDRKMTEHYTKKRAGDKVSPVKKKI
ncbi:MAG: tyrosine-type recombinase/integrase [Pseudomonadota bacterium]|nr:tyrosine-type recombinase/integrase [Pseudomonadota bacterium]